jgi:hypothetical protein
MQLGDRLVLPNLPEEGPFLIGEVVGSYDYNPLKLTEDTDINDLHQDYGHILPIRLLTQTISRYAEEVDAKLRGSLKTPMRMWCLDEYGDAIERLVDRAGTGTDLSVSASGEERLAKAWNYARAHAISELQARFSSELDARFQAAEWEEPIKTALEGLYPGANVRWVAGRSENGADILVQIRNAFGDAPWLIVIQVKNYVGTIIVRLIVE